MSEDIEISNSPDVFCLFSGGKDSVVATHLTMRASLLHKQKKAVVVYLDTKTGLPEQEEYVKEVCDKYNWQLWILRTHEEYEEKVEKYGFPGPAQHQTMYNFLKERQISKLTTVSEDPVFYTGVRQAESIRRMGNVEPIQEIDRAIWVAPIYDWSDDDVWDYIEENDIPENDEWKSGGRASDCFCGAYASPDELIDLEADHPEHAEWIRNLQDKVDRKDRRGTWGWGGLPENVKEYMDSAPEDDDVFTLCSTCRPGWWEEVDTDPANSIRDW